MFEIQALRLREEAFGKDGFTEFVLNEDSDILLSQISVVGLHGNRKPISGDDGQMLIKDGDHILWVGIRYNPTFAWTWQTPVFIPRGTVVYLQSLRQERGCWVNLAYEVLPEEDTRG